MKKIIYFFAKFLGILILLFILWKFGLANLYTKFILKLFVGINSILPLLGKIKLLCIGPGTAQGIELDFGEILIGSYKAKELYRIKIITILVNILPFIALILPTRERLFTKLKHLILGALIIILTQVIATFLISGLYIYQAPIIEGAKIFVNSIVLFIIPFLIWFIFIMPTDLKKKTILEKL